MNYLISIVLKGTLNENCIPKMGVRLRVAVHTQCAGASPCSHYKVVT